MGLAFPKHYSAYYSFCYLIINKVMLDLTAFRLVLSNLKTLKQNHKISIDYC
ncbi:hypothetical protein HMPREF0454_03628 [Hafnia alvei ATCC 51873]|uniref:Uncharacterized protein n=1 Tax=Hafnia alvei ATCC 51873 TaxID=1002364 RepID=G9YAK3_HAFAL|nr:hypothetical protein HMPREF0454_03628 [Hafnia alvei ATCC 51873]